MKRAAASVSRFTYLELENWRNFIRVQTAWQRRVFLLGANASGKSNFLDVFRFLRDIVAVGGGGFQAAVARRGGVAKLRCLFSRRYPELRVLVRVGTDEAPDEWTYELRFNQEQQRRVTLTREFVAHRDRTLLDRPDEEDRHDPQRLTQTHLEQINVNREFRALAEFFSEVKYLHVVPQLIREPDRSTGKRDDPYGGDFLEQVARVSEKTRNE